MKLFVITGFVCSLFIFFSCEKETQTGYTDSPIIEAYLSPGDFLNVTILRQTPFTSDAVYSNDDLDNLDVQVLFNGAYYNLSSMGGGVYQTTSIVVSEGDEYTISFSFNDKNVSAYTYIPSKPSGISQSAVEMEIEKTDSTTGPPSQGLPEPINIFWSNPDNSNYLILVENTESILDPIRDFGDDGPPSKFFRKEPTQGSSSEIRPVEFQYYGTHRVIIYHVLPDYASLYEENSTSSQNITNPSTSIINGYGIFTGLNSDTLFIEVVEP